LAKEWILNSAMNRFQLNFKRNVGPVSEEIRKCSPKEKKDWEQYYFENVRPKKHLEDSGRKLYIKIKEVISNEVDEITEEDCIEYIIEVVINRTYRGYMAEIGAIYEDLQLILNNKIYPASDIWDRKYCVDYYIKIKDSYIGLQIKSVRTDKQGEISHIPEIYKEQSIQNNAHKMFENEFGGKVFNILSIKGENGYKIQNEEVIPKIKNEIQRLELL